MHIKKYLESSGTHMKAFGYTKNSKILTASSIQAIELDTPTANGHDLLIEVNAISVNPVDTKIRANVAPEQGYKVLGWGRRRRCKSRWRVGFVI